ncbi:MAG: PilC/PilY family type IV pilus protein [Cocleimonas sp.]
MNILHKNAVTGLFSLMCLLLTSISHADDIDILEVEGIQKNANMLFIMDVSGSMSSTTSEIVTDADGGIRGLKRIEVLRNALNTFLTDPDIVDINIGLSSFAGDKDKLDQTAHGISYPVSEIDSDARDILDQNIEFDHEGSTYSVKADGTYTIDTKGNSYLPTIDDVTSRGYLQKIAKTWTPSGGTPIVDALFEAALYFRGQPTNWGKHDPLSIRSAHPSTYVGLLENTVTSTTTEYQCRQEACTGTECNNTKVCNSLPAKEICSTATCGTSCTALPATREVCDSGINSCGNGANCAPTTTRHTRDCSGNNMILCLRSHPTWHSCKTVTQQRCFDISGFKFCANVMHQQCVEDVDSNACDADQYECDVMSDSCEHEVCGDTSVNVYSLSGEGVFVSPIKHECQSNAIVLLSDGEPTVNNSTDLVVDMIGSSYSDNCDSGVMEGKCGPELAKFLATEDSSVSIDGHQNVQLYTVGMALGDNQEAEQYLKDLAEAGKGQYISATTSSALVTAFKKILENVGDGSARLFSSPSYSINVSTQLVHGNNVFLPVFKSGANASWTGNLKKYQLKDGDLYGKNDAGDLVKATGNSGRLKDNVRDLWATSKSKSSVTSGGAANKIDPDTRKVYTDNGASLLDIRTATTTQLGVASNDEKDKVLDYIEGKNSDGTPRHHMGDIIHSNPVQVATSATDGVIFVGTNEGFLHAIKQSTGEELFAYMPRALLKNIKPQFKNDILDNHLYGVDGAITLYHEDTNKNGIKESAEKAYLYFGLRRGGTSYYALDITNVSQPTLKWRSQHNTNFNELGYTWSKPKLAKLRYGSDKKIKPVLVFGGGYIDDHVTTQATGVGDGSNVYIVNALTGQLVWKAESSTITAAIPADIRTIDTNRDGSIDRLYFADVGGTIWRADLNIATSGNADYPGSAIKARVVPFAELGAVSTPATINRKFFNEPDVAIFRRHGALTLSVSIGSGDRTDPLNDGSDDQFFVLFDRSPMSIPATTPASIKWVDLGVPGSAKVDGWRMNLTNAGGEKVLAKALTFQNMVMFTTFGEDLGTSTGTAVDVCSPQTVSQPRLYVLDLLTGNATIDLNGDNKVDATDKSIEGEPGTIMGTPQVVFTKMEASGGGDCEAGDCVRAFEIRTGTGKAFATNNTRDANKFLSKSLPRVYWLDKNK